MRKLQPHEKQVVDALARKYYQTVPARFRTYCAVTSEVTRRVLASFGLDARLIPCQLWYMGPARNHVIGFARGGASNGKWDGHVVCGVGNLIVDAALLTLKADCGLTTPDVIVAGRFEVPTQFISRVDVGDESHLLWMMPPPGRDPTPPAETEALLDDLSASLIDRLWQEPDVSGVVRESQRVPLGACRSTPRGHALLATA